MDIFVKKISENELGYRNGIPRIAGICLIIPKNISSFFPILDDNTQVELIISNIPVKYEYKVSNIRDYDRVDVKSEYKLYLKSNVKTNEQFAPNDIIALTKNYNDFSYDFYHIKASESNYNCFMSVLNKYRSGRTYTALVPKEALPFL